jgi:hypothetical protein
MSSVNKQLALSLFLALFLTSQAHAKLFRNSYVQFELPDQWNCNIEGTEWVCSSQNKNDAKESIIILTAKEIGPQDSFQIYETYLKTPKPVQLSNGKTVLSQVKNVRTRKINDHPWVDSLHLGSEIPGYYTRYLATIKDKIAILVTLSAHQKFYTKYSTDYFKAVESLRVIASKDLLNQKALAPIKPGSQNLGVGGVNMPGGDNEVPVPESGSSGKLDIATLGGIFLLVAALTFYFLKKRRRQ